MYDIILADPPWRYNNKTIRGGAEHHYPTMTMSELSSLPVSGIAADNALLFLWSTGPLQLEAHQLIEAWGFKYKTLGFVWTKLNKNAGTPFIGTGHYTRANAEICLLAVRGNPKFKPVKAVPNVITTKIQKHSKKPNIHELIDSMYPGLKKIELFARDEVKGWDIWGNEVISTPLFGSYCEAM